MFIDGQNTYRGAREVFFGNRARSTAGQFDPVRLAQIIESRGGPLGRSCFLGEVRVYLGRPDPNRDPRTYAAHIKQCAKWEADQVTVVHRQLRYPPDWPNQRAEEKGVDIALAIDYVTMAIDSDYDIGVIVSTDTDLLPALEFVRHRYGGSRYPAVAWWRAPHGRRSRLSIRGSNIWCHWLSRADYDAVADPTDYNL